MLDDLASRRQAQARALLRQELKPGRAWSSLQYEYEREDQMYLGWLDLDPKKTTAQEIGEAIQAFTDRFHTAPTVVLVNEAELVEIDGMTVRSESYIRRNNYWVGMAE